jgi:pyridoxamine 5'-phosphate oxidase
MPDPAANCVDFDHPPADPLAWFDRWMQDARQTGLPNPNAMTLATIDPDGRPSARIVLLKSIDREGAVFFTNRMSRKGLALRANPRAALLFHWDALDRQVRIEGAVSLVGDVESDAYFATRSRGSQIGAWASAQSQPVAGRAELQLAVDEITRRYEGKDVPRPPHWGGYRISLDSIEFWQGDQFRLHDRVVYMPTPGGGADAWTVRRLCP